MAMVIKEFCGSTSGEKKMLKLIITVTIGVTIGNILAQFLMTQIELWYQNRN